ncbi:MAG: tRNA-dihydrouridine synthase, partial [Coxiellaceae bacterium]|nr:tRNA-dihydrouridine synthase [Coxiellaceae bacterium]
QMRQHLQHVDGVMLGREAYSNPYLFAEVDQQFYQSTSPIKTRQEVVLEYLPYVIEQHAKGVPLRRLTKNLIGLFQGMPGARAWRRYLSENSGRGATVNIVREALGLI